MSDLVEMEADAVRRAYKRWAPIYDNTFGKIADWGRKEAVTLVNSLGGRVLEVGVGTGMSLPNYDASVSVTGIDLSTAMLAKARKRVAREKLGNVEAVLEMDASDMEFPDGSFDVVVAMYVLTVVPDPRTVMSELSRVCKPGGDVLILNHFSSEDRFMRFVEKTAALWHQLDTEGYTDGAVEALGRAGYQAWKNPVGDIAVLPPEGSLPS